MLQNVYRLADFHFISKTESKLYKPSHMLFGTRLSLCWGRNVSTIAELETHLTLSVLKRKTPKFLWMISVLTMNHYHLLSRHPLQMSFLQHIHHPCTWPLISTELRALHYVSSLLHLLFFTKCFLSFLHQYSLLCWFGNMIHYCLLLYFFTGNRCKKLKEPSS